MTTEYADFAQYVAAVVRFIEAQRTGVFSTPMHMLSDDQLQDMKFTMLDDAPEYLTAATVGLYATLSGEKTQESVNSYMPIVGVHDLLIGELAFEEAIEFLVTQSQEEWAQ